MSARGLVCVASAVSWLHPLFQRPHQLALAFARRGFEVVYVEPGLVVEGVPERVEVGAAQIELWRFREELAPPYYHWLIDRSQRAIWKLRALLDPLGVREWYNASFRPWLRTRLRERLLAERLARHYYIEHAAHHSKSGGGGWVGSQNSTKQHKR